MPDEDTGVRQHGPMALVQHYSGVCLSGSAEAALGKTCTWVLCGCRYVDKASLVRSRVVSKGHKSLVSPCLKLKGPVEIWRLESSPVHHTPRIESDSNLLHVINEAVILDI